MRRFLFVLLMLALTIGLKSDPKQKIVFVSIPKSGTHLLKKAIRQITGNLPMHWIAINAVYRFDPHQDLELPMPITGAHLFPEIDLIRTECSSHYKKILMIRDPRDVMVSFMYHLDQQKIWAGKNQFDFEAFAKLPLDKRLQKTLLFPDEWRNPKTCFENAAKLMREPGVFIFRFEDLI